MQIKTDGLVIREWNVGESDRFVTILTRDKGLIKASARGARSPKSRLSAVCRLLCYSRFVLFAGREKYIIDDAEPLGLFTGLRSSLPLLSLGQYFCELAGAVSPSDEPAEPFLRLILNSLHLLERGQKPRALVKAGFELRLLTLAGYMPDLVACRGCGCYESDAMYLLPQSGSILCEDCRVKEGGPSPALRLSRGALAAARHIVYSEFEKVFSFSLPEKPLRELADASERYLVYELERTFPTLAFYKTVADA